MLGAGAFGQHELHLLEHPVHQACAQARAASLADRLSVSRIIVPPEAMLLAVALPAGRRRIASNWRTVLHTATPVIEPLSSRGERQQKCPAT